MKKNNPNNKKPWGKKQKRASNVKCKEMQNKTDQTIGEIGMKFALLFPRFCAIETRNVQKVDDNTNYAERKFGSRLSKSSDYRRIYKSIEKLGKEIDNYNTELRMEKNSFQDDLRGENSPRPPFRKRGEMEKRFSLSCFLTLKKETSLPSPITTALLLNPPTKLCVFVFFFFFFFM